MVNAFARFFLFILLSLSSLCATASYDCTGSYATEGTIRFAPDNPNDRQVVRITIDPGKWIFTGIEVRVEGKDVNVSVFGYPPGIYAPIEICDFVDIGPFPPGTYNVNYRLGGLTPGLPATTLVASRPLTVTAAPAPLVARIEIVSGDRRIEVVPAGTYYSMPSAPFVVKALGSDGTPLTALPLFLGSNVTTGYPSLFDEFGFRGFNAPTILLGDLRSEWFPITDANGVAQASPGYFDPPSSAFVVIAGTSHVPVAEPRAYFSVILLKQAPAGNPSVVVEYFNSDNGHYFNTLLQPEIDALDNGQFAGWKRSTGSFVAYATRQDAPADAVPVCRFFSSRFTSHFYTADAGECDSVIANLSEYWTLETREAFYIQVPDRATGKCATGLQPVHRMYNNKTAANHRYITDAKLRDHMTGRGWIAEGFGGAEAVMLCAPA